MPAPILGLLTPFRRDQRNDFAAGSGAPLLLGEAEQVLLTEGDSPVGSGEMPWRTAFGAGLTRLRHQRNDESLREVARVYVRDALRQWLPAARVVGVLGASTATRLRLQVQVAEGTEEATVGVEVER